MQDAFDATLQTPVPGSYLGDVQRGAVSVDVEPEESFVVVILNTANDVPVPVSYGLASIASPAGSLQAPPVGRNSVCAHNSVKAASTACTVWR